MQRTSRHGAHADRDGWFGDHQHVQEAGWKAEVDDQENRAGKNREQGYPVTGANDVAIALAVEETGDRGDYERSPGDAAEEEVDVDQDRPVRALEQSRFHGVA